MDYIGSDLYKNLSQVCVPTEDGEPVERRIKTDRRDARALCEACRLGAYRPAHRTSDRQRDVGAPAGEGDGGGGAPVSPAATYLS